MNAGGGPTARPQSLKPQAGSVATDKQTSSSATPGGIGGHFRRFSTLTGTPVKSQSASAGCWTSGTGGDYRLVPR